MLKSLFWAVEADWIAAVRRAVGAVHERGLGAVSARGGERGGRGGRGVTTQVLRR